MLTGVGIKGGVGHQDRSRVGMEGVMLHQDGV